MNPKFEVAYSSSLSLKFYIVVKASMKMLEKSDRAMRSNNGIFMKPFDFSEKDKGAKDTLW